MKRRPVLSPIARPGRRYISGILYLALALLAVAGLFLLRGCIVHSLASGRRRDHMSPCSAVARSHSCNQLS